MFETPLPETVEQWEVRRGQLRERLWWLLGDLPALIEPEVRIDSKEQRRGYTLEKLSFDNGFGDTVYGYLLVPDGCDGAGPAVLYHHQHGGKYERGKEEVLVKTYKELDFATGEELVRQGYVVLCIDAYAFGGRQCQGPAGENERGGRTETSLFKMHLWQGRSLWGMMVRDDMLALNYLASRGEVDGGRIAAMGMSMGSTRTWWLAALDDRIRAAVSVACLTRYQDLIAAGQLRQHGIYYFVPAMLRHEIDTESVVGLIAPRAHLTLTGDSDGGSPVEGVRKINAFAEKVYDVYGAADRFRGVVYPGLGHDYTRVMWDETMQWLGKHV